MELMTSCGCILGHKARWKPWVELPWLADGLH